jgi:APA family basic amino acid/polyamine antiporter
MSDTRSEDPVDVQSFAGGQRLFLRNATGLVRVARPWDMAIYNIAGSVVIPYATGMFWAYTIWPHTNFLIAILAGGVLCSFVWATWALLAATMPRTGGGYIFNSRILNPVLGFAGDWLGGFLQAALAMALWTTWFATVALAGAFSVWGALRHNDTVSGYATTVADHAWTFGLGAALTIAIFGVAMWSFKKSLRLQNLTFYISTGGLILAVIVMLFTSQSDYIHSFNHFAQSYTHQKDSYHQIIATARKNGFHPGGFTAGDTVGSIYVILTVSVWAWGSAYMGGEMRGARSASRQLRVMVGSGTFQVLLIFAATALFLHAAGNDFFSSINYLNSIGKNPLPAPPYYTLLAGVAVTSPILTAIITFSFVFGIWCGLWNLIPSVTRTLFAYSFDGILPERISRVNARTRTPIYALALMGVVCLLLTYWATFDNSGFFGIWAYVGLFAFCNLTLVSISAILLPNRRRADYEASPARRSVFGIPVVRVLGVLSLATCLFYFAIIFIHPSLLGTVSLLGAWEGVAAAALSAVVIYYIAKAVRKRSGVRLDAVFNEIPPE